jgi:hypothetical protein
MGAEREGATYRARAAKTSIANFATNIAIEVRAYARCADMSMDSPAANNRLQMLHRAGFLALGFYR